MSKLAENKKFEARIPSGFDSDNLFFLKNKLINEGVFDIEMKGDIIAGTVSSEDSLGVIRILNNNGIPHDLKLKKTFWKTENIYGKMNPRTDRIAEGIFSILALLIIPKIIFGTLFDYYWFESVGYSQVFMTNFVTKIQIFSVVLVAMLIIFFVNWKWIKKTITESESNTINDVKIAYTVISIAISFIVALLAKGLWFKYLQYINQAPFENVDPIFGNNIAFYVFSVPFQGSVLLLATAAISAVMVATLITHIMTDEKRLLSSLKSLPANIKIQYAILMFLIAGLLWLHRYASLYSDSGVVYGAGYVDVHFWIPVWTIVSAIFTVSGIILLLMSLFNDEVSKQKIPGLVLPIGTATILSLAVIILLGVLGGGLTQMYKVSPNEMNIEAEFIEYDIDFTRDAYGLNIKEAIYNNTGKLNESVLASASVKNARILDWRPTKILYQQVQTLRSYYGIYDIDIDRYNVDGEMRQVMIGIRELDTNLLKAQTWQNLWLVFTHGYGIVMSPVNEKAAEGGPVMWIENMPLASTKAELNVNEPRIYYGELTDTTIITGTNTQEFDYPSGDENVYSMYNGTGGMEISTGLKKFVIAWKTSPLLINLKLYTSDEITKNSKIHLYRNIVERTEKIAPFMCYDNDPYIYSNSYELNWITHGITYTNEYPYSEPGVLHIESDDWGDSVTYANYARDATKVQINALNGTVDFYKVTDKDPLLETYSRIYPTLFKEQNSMPEDLKDHIKYPEDLFSWQSNKLLRYHMKDLQVFYNKEDVWEIGSEKHGTSKQVVLPYNIIWENNGKTEFILMIPFTPLNKANLVGWLAVKQDYPNYGEFLLYKFPKGRLVYGTMQMENRIDANQEISREMTLWGQGGSEVIRGNLLVIPVNDAILYIEPVYIKATSDPSSSGKESIPELKKIIAIYDNPDSNDDMIVWDDTLEKAVLKAVSSSGMKATSTEIGGTSEEICTEKIITIWDKNDNKVAEFKINCDYNFIVSS